MDDEQTALRSFLMSCTVPLAIEDRINQGVQGTGTLFRLGGKPYFVTARHVVDNLDFDKVGIPTAPTDSFARRMVEGKPRLLKEARVQNFGRVTVVKPLEACQDVAVLVLEDEEFVAAVEQTWTFLTAANLWHLGERAQRFLICGFPVALGQQVPGSTLFPPLLVSTQMIPPPDGIAWDSAVDGTTDIFFAYDKKVRRSGQIVDSPKLPGMSGSAVWAVLEDQQDGSLWTPETRLRVAGIQVRYCHSRYIRAKKLGLLESLFGQVNPAAAREIRAAIRSGA
jgi:hypothetical protein